MVKEAVGEWAAKLFVEEHEHEGDLGSFVGEPTFRAGTVRSRLSRAREQLQAIVDMPRIPAGWTDNTSGKLGKGDAGCSRAYCVHPR